MSKKWIWIIVGVIALITMGIVAYVSLQTKKDNTAGIINWISSPTV